MIYRVFKDDRGPLFTAYVVHYDSAGNVTMFDCIGSAGDVRGIKHVIEAHSENHVCSIKFFDEITAAFFDGHYQQGESEEERIELGSFEASPGSVIIATVNHDGMSKKQADEYDQAISAKLKASFKDHRHIVVDQRITLSVLDISNKVEIAGSVVQR